MRPAENTLRRFRLSRRGSLWATRFVVASTMIISVASIRVLYFKRRSQPTDLGGDL